MERTKPPRSTVKSPNNPYGRLTEERSSSTHATAGVPDNRGEGKAWWISSRGGRSTMIKSPKVLWKAACEYFEWVENNPILSAKSNMYKGKVLEYTEPKVRAMSILGLCIYLGIAVNTYRNYRNGLYGNEFTATCSHIEAVIFTQKFENAAAGLLNSNIIARDLQLRDTGKEDMSSQSEEHRGKDDTKLDFSSFTVEELKTFKTLVSKAKGIDDNFEIQELKSPDKTEDI